MSRRAGFLWIASLPVPFLVFSLSGGEAAAAKSIDPQLLSVTDCPSSPGCPALVLLQEIELDNDGQRTTYSFRRLLKVFTEQGITDYADVEIRANIGDFEIRNLRGRTILPDGSERPLAQDNIFVSSLREGKRRVRTKTAKFPGVVPGAIIEHSYDLVTEPFTFITEDTWPVQDDLPVLRTKYSIKEGDYPMAWVETGSERVPIKETTPWKGLRVLESLNVPALPDEPFSPSRSAIQTRVHFALPESQSVWLPDFAGRIAGFSGNFIDKGTGVAEKVAEMVSAEDPPLERVRKIYKFVQEKIGSEEERAAGKEASEAKDAENAGEVLSRGFGTEFERTLLFLAMVKRAGLEHGLLVLAGRFTSDFNKDAPDTDQFDSFAAAVKTGTGWTFYDPATRYCPFGMISAEKEGSGHNGIMLTPQAGAGKRRQVRVRNLVLYRAEPAPFSIVRVPISAAARNVLTRNARIVLKDDGSAEVEAHETGTGLADLDHRESYAALDEEKRREAVTEAIQDSIPPAELVSHEFENLESFTSPAKVHYKLRIPGLAQAAGDRILVTPSIYGAFGSNPFTAESRRTPVVMKHTRIVRDVVRLEIPEGYEVQELPAAVVVRDSPFVLTASYLPEGNSLVLNRKVEIDSAHWPVADYPRLKTFFGKIKEADDQVIVLVRRAP